MAQSKVEIVRAIYERWGRGDFRAGLEHYDPHVQFILRPGFPDAGVYTGPAEIRRYMQDDFLANLEGAAIAGEEFIDAGNSVVVQVNQSATGAGSGAPVAMRYYQVWTFRGEGVIRIESMRDARPRSRQWACAASRCGAAAAVRRACGALIDSSLDESFAPSAT